MMQMRIPVAVVILLAACTGDTAAPRRIAPQEMAPSVHVEASRADAVLMVRTPSALAGERGGTSLQLDETVYNPRGRALPHKQHIEWSSSNTDIATVDSTGLVTALDTGNVLIVVDHKSSSDTVRVRVIPVPVASVTATGPDSLSLDDTASYLASTLDSAGEPLHGRLVMWRSSNPAALMIGTASGVATALAEGTVFVTATSEAKEGTVTTKVWPQPVATIDVSPASASVALYRAASFTAMPRDRRGKALIGRVLTWRTSNPSVFTINAAGVVTTVAPGSASAIAESEGKQGIGALTVTNPVEARALWVNRFDYSTEAHIVTIMQRAGRARFNIVYFQVRGAGDALYSSSLEPCSPRLCVTLGGGRVNAVPPFDPLAVAVREGARNGIQVHAWLNAYTGWISGSSSACNLLIESTPRHMLKAHPGWIMTDRAGAAMPCATTSEYIWVSPGNPGVRTQLARVAADIARRYDVKGIHLDRIRYPGTTVSYDTASVNDFNRTYGFAAGTLPASSSAAWASFRRAFVNAGVREVHDSLLAVRPSLVLSAAIWPIYRLPAGWTAGSKGYDDYYQDARAWTAGGYLDVADPMMYPGSATSTSYIIKPTYCATLDWLCLLDEHRQVIEGRDGRHVYVGVGAIRGWPDLSAELAAARQREVTGVSIYNYGTLNAIANSWDLLANGYFSYPATIPPMPWK